MKTCYLTKFFFTALLIFYSVSLFSQSGTLDKSFGTDGKVLNEAFTGDCHVVAVQQDGKIITGGFYSDYDVEKTGFLVTRFNADGSLDKSFGNGGEVITSGIAGSRASIVVALAIQPDGKILAGGNFVTHSAFIDVGVIRYNTDGSVDSSFGKGGAVVTDIGLDDNFRDMVLQPDGKIDITGNKGVKENTFNQGFVIRYLPDGSIDKSFGNKGIVLSDFGYSDIIYRAIALQPDGKILAGGLYAIYRYLIVRYNTDGTLDKTFGSEGLATLILASEDTYSARFNDITIQRDGKIVGAGSAGPNDYHFSLCRFDSTGKIDFDFGGNKTGYTVLPMESGYSIANTVNVTDDGKIISTGIYNAGPNTGLGAIGYKNDGTVDSSFGINGVAVTGFDNLDQIPFYTGGALQSDGKIVIGGAFLPTSEADFSNIALVRFNADNPEKYVHIKHWLHKHGITWDDKPNNLTNYYAIERSSDGNSFSEIARIFNRNNQTQFSYEDNAPLNGTNYYRLRTVSTDGAVAYSNIVTIADDGSAAIKIYPNPAQNNLQIEGLSATQKTKLTVLDFSGNVKATSITNNSSYNLNISQLKQGNYILRIETNENVITKKFVKD